MAFDTSRATTTGTDQVLPAGAALSDAAAAAGYAPSIHNTQPWRWKIRSRSLELWSVRTRRLPITDPDGRMAAISCGAALHHARVAMAALGYRSAVRLLPDPARSDHLAQVTVTAQQAPTPATLRLSGAMALRCTDRRPVAGPIAKDALLAVTMAVQAEGCYLHVLRADQVIELAAAASYAQRAETADEAWRAELAYWAGGTRPTGAGVPDWSIPADPPQTTVPGRDFGRGGTLPVSASHDSAATYAILYSDRDDLDGWLQAGQALSAGWLAATETGASLLPLSAVVEVLATRQRLGEMLIDGCYPHLVLRLGTADSASPGPASTPRLPAAQTVEMIDD